MNNSSLLYRFDHARLGSFHLKLVILAGSCWVWAAYGITIVGFILPTLKTEWNISANAQGILASAGMVGMLIGSISAGIMADRFGRRSTLTWIMFYLGIMFLISGLSVNYLMLFILRLFTGIGLGAILPVSGILVAELSPSHHRGTMVVLLNCFWGLGGTLAALIGYTLVLHVGWRPAMFFGGLALLISPLIHWMLPESLRFLLEKGWVEQAQQESARVHLEIDSAHAIENVPDQPKQNTTTEKPASMLTHAYLHKTLVVWFLWFSLNFLYQGVFIWLPTLLAANSSSISHSFLITMLISLGQVPGTLLVAALADRFNRRNLIIVSLTLLGLATITFGMNKVDGLVLILGFLLMIFNGMAWGLVHPFVSELYPTRMRGSATGWANGIGRVGGVIAPVAAGWIIQSGGKMPVIFSVLAVGPLLAAFVLSGLRVDTTGRSLEDITGN
jgi:MFS transporter, putative metabolite:H+ symporter